MKSYQEVIKELQTNETEGLTKTQVEEKTSQFGPNALQEKKKTPLIIKFLSEFKDFMVIILLIAAVVSVIADHEEWIESLIILIVVLINAILGVAQESKAEKSLEALKKLSTPNAKVIRDGVSIKINSSEIVPGDILLVEAGDFVPADAMIIESANLVVDESALTGESVPVNKNNQHIEKEDVAIGDMTNCLFSSTYVTYGRAKAVVTGTGMNTEIGKIAGMLMNEENTQTPLQHKLDQIGKTIGIICIFVCVIVFAMELFALKSITKEGITSAFMTAIALTVAAIPEGLATVVTVVLAIGVDKMAKRQAIVKKLPAVETLGCASIICSDKTGTLTQNKMTVVKYYHNNNLKNIEDNLNDKEQAMIEYFSLCSDAKSEVVDGELKEIGDPTEIALVVACQKYVKNKMININNRFADLPFDSDRKMMTVIYKYNGKFLSITKGAPDIILEKSSYKPDEKRALLANEEMASDALRVLGIGYRIFDTLPELTSENIENDLTFVGLVGMIDPARPEVKESIRLASKAGIRTIMITGDHVKTAEAIAKQLGILRDGDLAIASSELQKMTDEELFDNIEKYSVYARVAPEDKVRIVETWQKKGHIVSMTGDGVNDSPALKKADIGCAMGITGTDVAKEAADLVLVDDNFGTIVEAIKHGRGIYANIKKVVMYLLSSNIGEVLAIFLASLISALFIGIDFGDPLLPIHLLMVNLVTDTFPSFALGCEVTDDEVMNESPRPKTEGFFAHKIGIVIFLEGVMIGLLTFAAYAIGHFANPNSDLGHTMAFMTLASSQLFHAFNMKSNKSILNKKLFNNKWLIISFVALMAVQLLVCYITPVANVFQLVALEPKYLMICLGLAASTIVFVELGKLIVKLTNKK